jgi:AcrR family transcriptional regulator
VNDRSTNVPRSPAQNEALRAATRERLLDAALALFARDGYAETTVRAIAARAGVAAGLLYAHFDGKEALLHALFERSMADVRRSFALADAADPRERLAALVRGAVAVLRGHLDFWRLGYAVRAQPSVVAALGPALGNWAAEIHATLRGYLAALGSPAPELDAHALFTQIDGLCQHFALAPADFPVDAVAERVIARWAGAPPHDPPEDR